MSAPIAPISVPNLLTAAVSPLTTTQTASSGASFDNFLSSAIAKVENAGNQATAAVENYLNGGNQELHSTILATQNADLNFQMFLQVRNKVVSAYEEIMKMQV
jgi:flagellar hook-basal body complex protein FliE